MAPVISDKSTAEKSTSSARPRQLPVLYFTEPVKNHSAAQLFGRIPHWLTALAIPLHARGQRRKGSARRRLPEPGAGAQLTEERIEAPRRRLPEPGAGAQLTEERIEALRALGYIDSEDGS